MVVSEGVVEMRTALQGEPCNVALWGILADAYRDAGRDADVQVCLAVIGMIEGEDLYDAPWRHDDMIVQYLQTALWSSREERDEPCIPDGMYLDETFEIEDFSPAAITQAVEDCCRFYLLHLDGIRDEITTDQEQWGHDLWLSRNGHGVGFFDGEEHYGEHADALQEAADDMGECYIYVDGMDRLTLDFCRCC